MKENISGPVDTASVNLDSELLEMDAGMYTYPSLQKRIQSIMIDTLVIIVGMVVTGIILNAFSDVPEWMRALCFIMLWGVYEPFCMAFGCTAGNAVTGIRVRRVADKQKCINLFQSYIRYIFKITLGWLSFLVITANTERRAIHDLISGSVMIEI